jgi:ketosteroid isomerase-like protein
VRPDDASDRLAVSALLDDYAFGIDTKDWALVASVFTPDAVLDYTAFGGPNGPADEILSWIRDSVNTFPMTQHHITNRRITIDGDGASCSAELFAPMGIAAAEGKMNVLFTGGRYVDTFRRTSDGWKISARVCENAWLGMGPEVRGPSQPT